MCFRPPTVDLADTKCPICGHENFIGVTKCAQCGATYNDAPVGTESAGTRDWTEGLEFNRQAIPQGAAQPKPPGAAQPKPPVQGAPRMPGGPKPPTMPKTPPLSGQ